MRVSLVCDTQTLHIEHQQGLLSSAPHAPEPINHAGIFHRTALAVLLVECDRFQRIEPGGWQRTIVEPIALRATAFRESLRWRLHNSPCPAPQLCVMLHSLTVYNWIFYEANCIVCKLISNCFRRAGTRTLRPLIDQFGLSGLGFWLKSFQFISATDSAPYRH